MTRVSQSAIQVRSELSKARGPGRSDERHPFVFEFDGSETTKELPLGWKPYAVYLDGSRQFEGSSDDYTVTFDGFKYSVVWAVAPSNTSACHIDAERQNA